MQGDDKAGHDFSKRGGAGTYGENYGLVRTSLGSSELVMWL